VTVQNGIKKYSSEQDTGDRLLLLLAGWVRSNPDLGIPVKKIKIQLTIPQAVSFLR